MVKGISKLVMDLTVRLTCVKGKVKSDSIFDLSFAKDQMCSKSNFSSRLLTAKFLPKLLCAAKRDKTFTNSPEKFEQV